MLNYFLPQVYKDSDIDIFTFGTPINTVSLFTILLHLSIEIKAWVSPKRMDICYNRRGMLRQPKLFCLFFLTLALPFADLMFSPDSLYADLLMLQNLLKSAEICLCNPVSLQ